MIGLRRAFATKVVDPLAWKAKGTPVGTRLREFRKQQWDDRETFERRRNDRLAKILLHAVTHVPFYRERVSGLTPEGIRADPLGSLARFPILEKHDVRDNPDDLMSETGHRLVVQHTSGSTGMPLTFYRDTHSLGASLATTQLALEWAGAERGGRRVRLWPLSAGASRPSLLKRLVNRIHDRVVLSCFLMTDETIRGYLRILNARPIDILDGPPTAFVEIASFAERNGLELPRPRAVVSGGSALYGHLRERIAEAYGAPVFDHYGCYEVGLIGSDCERHNGIHVFGETIFLEVVDEDGRPVEPGAVGELIATHLWQTSMPFIRYRMADRGVMSTERCDCGRPHRLLDSIVGRSGQSFTRSDGTLVAPEVFAHVVMHEHDTPDVRRFQVVQEAPDHIVVRFIPERGTEGIAPDVREQMSARLSEIMRSPCRVEFVAEESIDPTPSGKYLFAISKVTSGVPDW